MVIGILPLIAIVLTFVAWYPVANKLVPQENLLFKFFSSYSIGISIQLLGLYILSKLLGGYFYELSWIIFVFHFFLGLYSLLFLLTKPEQKTYLKKNISKINLKSFSATDIIVMIDLVVLFFYILYKPVIDPDFASDYLPYSIAILERNMIPLTSIDFRSTLGRRQFGLSILVAYLLSLSTLTDESFRVFSALSLIAGLLTSIELLKRTLRYPEFDIAKLIIVLMPFTHTFMMVYSFYPDSIFFFLSSFALLSMVKYSEEQNFSYLLLGSLAAGVSVLFKLQGMALVAAFFSTLLILKSLCIQPKKWQSYVLLALVSLIPVSFRIVMVIFETTPSEKLNALRLITGGSNSIVILVFFILTVCIVLWFKKASLITTSYPLIHIGISFLILVMPFIINIIFNALYAGSLLYLNVYQTQYLIIARQILDNFSSPSAMTGNILTVQLITTLSVLVAPAFGTSLLIFKLSGMITILKSKLRPSELSLLSISIFYLIIMMLYILLAFPKPNIRYLYIVAPFFAYLVAKGIHFVFSLLSLVFSNLKEYSQSLVSILSIFLLVQSPLLFYYKRFLPLWVANSLTFLFLILNSSMETTNTISNVFDARQLYELFKFGAISGIAIIVFTLLASTAHISLSNWKDKQKMRWHFLERAQATKKLIRVGILVYAIILLLSPIIILLYPTGGNPLIFKKLIYEDSRQNFEGLFASSLTRFISTKSSHEDFLLCFRVAGTGFQYHVYPVRVLDIANVENLAAFLQSQEVAEYQNVKKPRYILMDKKYEIIRVLEFLSKFDNRFNEFLLDYVPVAVSGKWYLYEETSYLDRNMIVKINLNSSFLISGYAGGSISKVAWPTIRYLDSNNRSLSIIRLSSGVGNYSYWYIVFRPLSNISVTKGDLMVLFLSSPSNMSGKIKITLMLAGQKGEVITFIPLSKIWTPVILNATSLFPSDLNELILQKIELISDQPQEINVFPVMLIVHSQKIYEDPP
jgi:hypothetical protein